MNRKGDVNPVLKQERNETDTVGRIMAVGYHHRKSVGQAFKNKKASFHFN